MIFRNGETLIKNSDIRRGGEPTLHDVVSTLGGDQLAQQLRTLFGLDERLQPICTVNFLRYIDATRSPRVAALPPEGIPIAFVTLADYARSVLSIRSFIESTSKDFQLHRLVTKREGDRPRPSTVSNLVFPAVEHELIWDDPQVSLSTTVRTSLKGLLFIALLSGEAPLMVRRLSLARELSKPTGGRLTRLQGPSIREHECKAVTLLEDYLSNPQQRGKELRELLRRILDMQFSSVSRWKDPVPAYQRYQELRPVATPVQPSAPVTADPRYRSGFTMEDLRSPSRVRALYGSSVYLDEDRFGVLDDMIAYFGPDRCFLARGEFHGKDSLDVDTSAIDHTYVILVVDSGRDEPYKYDAIAISPFAGAHAVYYVRSDAAQRSWQDVLATGRKILARALGARRLPFRGGSEFDPYESMTMKLQALAECTAEEFYSGRKLQFDKWSMAYAVVC